jgi:hypothetical protein
MEAKTPSKTRTGGRVSLAIGVLAVALCLAAGAWFIWWSIAGGADNGTIKLSESDLAQMQTTSGRMQFQNNGGSLQVNSGPQLFGGIGPDTLSLIGSHVATIHTGRVLVIVNGLTKPPTIIFRQRVWAELREPWIFVIARRSVHEKSVAVQLNETPEQLAKLTALVATPAVQQKYISALPLSPAELADAQKAWADFAAGLPGSRAHPQALYQTMSKIGEAALTRAQRICYATDKAISTVLTPEQIKAYQQGRALAP